MATVRALSGLAAAANSRLANVGSFAMGVVMAMFAWYFVPRLGEHTLEGFGILVGILAAGTIIAFVDKLRGGTDGLASYAIGLMIGSVGFVLVGLLDPQGPWFPAGPSSTPTPTPTPAS